MLFYTFSRCGAQFELQSFTCKSTEALNVFSSFRTVWEWFAPFSLAGQPATERGNNKKIENDEVL